MLPVVSWPWSHLVVGLKTTCVISAYHHLSCEFESHYYVIQFFSDLRQSVVFSIKRNDITAILLKVVLNTITLTLNQFKYIIYIGMLYLMLILALIYLDILRFQNHYNNIPHYCKLQCYRVILQIKYWLINRHQKRRNRKYSMNTLSISMKNKNTVIYISPKIVETEFNIDTPNIHIQDYLLTWLATENLIKSGRVKLVLPIKTSTRCEMMW